MKKQSETTRVRTPKDMDTVTTGPSKTIKPKSSISIPQENNTNRKTQPDQLAGNYTVYAPTLNSTQGPKVVCVYAGRKELAK
jgi:hypothetical protein